MEVVNIPDRDCKGCKYLYVCRYDRSHECLDREPRFSLFEEGNPDEYRKELEKSGEVNIVIGREGEHEINAKWSIEEAYDKLAYVCECCGGLVTHVNSFMLELQKPYDGLWWIEYMDGELYRIRRVITKDWWINDDVD